MKTQESLDDYGSTPLQQAFSVYGRLARTCSENDDFQHRSEIIATEPKIMHCEPCVRNGDGFCLAITLHDAITLHVAGNVKDLLGYRKNMLLGQSFLRYLFPRDRVIFVSQVTQALQSRFDEHGKGQGPSGNYFFCRIRLYQELKKSFSIVRSKVRYKPFQMTLKDAYTDDCLLSGDHTNLSNLLVTAIPVLSAYQVPEEVPTMTSFSTRHTPACYFSHIDLGAIPYLGYFPQDIIGFSVFDFYHPKDMLTLKDTYSLVMKEQGSSFLGKPYDFKVANGCYVTLETEWSCFINPWMHKVEFVIGRHRILKGPKDPDVFSKTHGKEESTFNAPCDFLMEKVKMEKEIQAILARTIRPQIPQHGLRCTKRKRHLVSRVNKIVDKFHQGIQSSDVLKEELYGQPTSKDNLSVTMDSVSSTDSKVSSDDSVSSQEIKHYDNIDRYFSSVGQLHENQCSDIMMSSVNQHEQQFGKERKNGIQPREISEHPPRETLTEDHLAKLNRINKEIMKQRHYALWSLSDLQRHVEFPVSKAKHKHLKIGNKSNTPTKNAARTEVLPSTSGYCSRGCPATAQVTTPTTNTKPLTTSMHQTLVPVSNLFLPRYSTISGMDWQSCHSLHWSPMPTSNTLPIVNIPSLLELLSKSKAANNELRKARNQPVDLPENGSIRSKFNTY